VPGEGSFETLEKLGLAAWLNLFFCKVANFTFKTLRIKYLNCFTYCKLIANCETAEGNFYRIFIAVYKTLIFNKITVQTAKLR
jgi:hypothetical protein